MVESARSALVKGIYKDQGVAFPEHLYEDFKVGYRRMVRKEIQTGERDDNSSDFMLLYPISYRMIIFFVLMWNMAYRGDSMDEQYLVNYSWDIDTILINLARSKGNQGVSGKATETRLTANPNNP